jgi:hypothetical protein
MLLPGRSLTIDAEPLLWWYEPKDPSHLFMPALDAHDGLPPEPGSDVDVDHVLVVGRTTSARWGWRRTLGRVFASSVSATAARRVLIARAVHTTAAEIRSA